MNNKIFIVHRTQFGYHTDVLKWCEYLKSIYHIDVLCFDEKHERLKMEGVRVHYVHHAHGKIISWVRFLLRCIVLLANYKGVIIVGHFRESRFVKKILPWKKMILDIRTFSVHPDDRIRKYEDEQLYKSVRAYDYVTVISEGLRRLLPKPMDFTAVLPLGADILINPPKTYDSIDLLYVGTFYNRHIEDTIIGFAKAREKVPVDVKMSYHIVGFGLNDEEEIIRNTISEYGQTENVFFHGRISHDSLSEYYEMCNFGVSYVPMTHYYDFQPVTKTFEYIMAGLFTIATATQSNKDVITKENGLLISDDAISFADAIINIVQRRNMIDSERVRYSLNEYTWEHIVKQTMVEILNDFNNKF